MVRFGVMFRCFCVMYCAYISKRDNVLECTVMFVRGALQVIDFGRMFLMYECSVG